MTVDQRENPYFATYWTPKGSDIPQYHLMWKDGVKWNTSIAGNRKQAFSLSGGGTKRIPI